jgi:hypothetical protein
MKKQYVITEGILYFLGSNGFNRIYLQIKDDSWLFVNLIRLAKDSSFDLGSTIEGLDPELIITKLWLLYT